MMSTGDEKTRYSSLVCVLQVEPPSGPIPPVVRGLVYRPPHVVHERLGCSGRLIAGDTASIRASTRCGWRQSLWGRRGDG